MSANTLKCNQIFFQVDKINLGDLMRIHDTENYNKVKDCISMKNLAKLIEEKNLSITNVAQFADITLSNSTISAYISGDKLPSIPTLISLADYLDCNIDYLLGREDNPIRVSNIESITNNNSLSSLFNNIHSLSKDKQKLVEAYVKGLMDND